MMKRIEIALSFTLALVLMGCVHFPVPLSGSETETPYLTSTPAPIPTSTQTEVPQSSRDNAFLIDNCLIVETNPMLNWNSEGVLILSGEEYIGNNLVRRTGYKIKMDTRERVELSTSDVLFYMAVSPSGKRLAYRLYSVDNNSANLVIFSAASEQQLSIPWENEWYWIASWLDENRLMIGTGTNSFLVLNPFTNERVDIQPDFPEIYSVPGYAGLKGTGYSPELDRVVYLQGDRLFLEPLHYVLWDIDQQQTLASFEVVIVPTAFPRWLPDGSQFVLAASIKDSIIQTWPAYELYVVTRDGQVTHLTNLTDYYSWVYIEDYSWSPNGRYIAFWFSTWSNEKPDWELQAERYLAVVDTDTKIVTNYCISGKPADNGRVPLPVWSPDGTQLAVETLSSDGQSQVVLINLSSNSAIQIGEDMTPVGWMVSQ